MTVKFKNVEVDCEEFNCYIQPVNDETSCEIDLLINADLDMIEEIYSDPFIVIIERTGYVFNGYQLDEYFDEGGLTKVICRK